MKYSASIRSMGLYSASLLVILEIAYAITLIIGLMTLPDSDQPIGDPLFSILEILILCMMPAFMCLFAAIHAYARPGVRAFTLLALLYVTLLSGITMTLHFFILTLRHTWIFTQNTLWTQAMSFRWPSVAYALDILAWDVFFALAVFCAATAFHGNSLRRAIRILFIISGILALLGLMGIPLNNMQYRNIGIIGYVPVFTAAVILTGTEFYRSVPE